MKTAKVHQTKFQVRLEVADGFDWVTVLTDTGNVRVDNGWEEWISAKLDNVLKLPNAIHDIPSLAHANDGEGLLTLYGEIERAR